MRAIVAAAIPAGRLPGKRVGVCFVQSPVDDPGGILVQRFGRLTYATFSRAADGEVYVAFLRKIARAGGPPRPSLSPADGP